MSREVREADLEDAIEDSLLAGKWRRREKEDFDRALCLVPRDVVDFVVTTQPQTWKRLGEHHGAEVKDRFLRRVSGEITKRGVLDVLRNGVKDSGCSFALAYFQPGSGLNEDTRRRYEGNLFAAVRQVHYSEKNENSIDLVLCLNGLPVFTAELKNELTSQDVSDAKRQYCTSRDPKEPLFAFRRCLAHFAVDPEQVEVTTRVVGDATRFLPFNRGKFGGKGNEPVPPTKKGYPTSYLWEEVWAKDSVLDLVQNFIHEFDEEDQDGKKTGNRILLFPRYHQLDAVRRLVAHAREYGPGQRYLVQHSAGSGKSNSIAWLAHRLSTLHDAKDRRVFDSIVLITDRRVLDRQLQRTVAQFAKVVGVVENIDQTSRQLKEALESGKTIIVTTLQKFPVIAGQMSDLPGKRFAVIVDEAHSSQSGESTKSLKQVLSAHGLEEAEADEAGEPIDLEDKIVDAMKARGPQPNVSTFAFTATPKQKTLELFGTRRADDKFEPFSLYSMRQAIEEGFILDVLEHYTTLKTYWSLLKKAQDDPHVDRTKASYLLRAFVDLHPHAIAKKIEIVLAHFADHVESRIGHRAKAMIVTRSRLHAVRYRLEIDRQLRARGLPCKALVAFSGTVEDGGASYTEAGMNGFSDRQTAKSFRRPEYRFLVVAEKFQTGFDEPLLHTMYVDKKLSGVNAVQTLSRLNRTIPGHKSETIVLDFANETDEIREAFQPYYERTLLAEATDPNLVYDRERELYDFHLFTKDEVQAFAALWFGASDKEKQQHAKFYAVLLPVKDRFDALPADQQDRIRSALSDYVRLFVFLSQLLTFADADLEKLYHFARFLRRLVRATKDDLPREVLQAVDMESYRVQQTSKGKIALEKGVAELMPLSFTGPMRPLAGEEEPLSKIIRELNERFGTDFTDEDRVVVRGLYEALAADDALVQAVRVNPPENARLSFEQKAKDRMQGLVDTNFKLYKRITDDEAFAKVLLDMLFEMFRARAGEPI